MAAPHPSRAMNDTPLAAPARLGPHAGHTHAAAAPHCLAISAAPAALISPPPTPRPGLPPAYTHEHSRW